MKKLLTIFAITIFSIQFINAQEQQGVPFVAYWEVGDSYNFQVDKVKKAWKVGKQSKNDSSSYVVNFEVIDSTETSYTIDWTYETTLISDLDLNDEVNAQLITKLNPYKYTSVKYKTTEVGAFVEILNWEEISEMMKTALDIVIEEKSKGENSAEMKEALKPFRAMFETKAGIEQVLLKELQYFHFPFGFEFDQNTPLDYEDELPNVLGGKPLRADARLAVESVNFEDNFAVLKHTMNVNEKDAKEFLNTMFQQMGVKDKDVKKMIKKGVFNIEDDNTFEYFFYPGVPYLIETKRNTIVEFDGYAGRNYELIRIQLVE